MISKNTGLIALFLSTVLTIPIVTGMAQAKPLPVDQRVDSVVSENRRPRSQLKDYVLIGTDEKSNAYTGDTDTTEAHGLACIKKLDLPQPSGLSPAPSTTPGGALRDSWSGGYLFVVPNVIGTTLTSRAVADNICNKYGQSNYGVTDYRMAEFHDGDQRGWAGWSFWGDAAYSATRGFEGFNDRLWVAINDQNANAWQSSKALTFSNLAQVKLPGQVGIGNKPAQ